MFKHNLFYLILFKVINELEGLSRGAKSIEIIGKAPGQALLENSAAYDHAAMVVKMSKSALEFINSKDQSIKWDS